MRSAAPSTIDVLTDARPARAEQVNESGWTVGGRSTSTLTAMLNRLPAFGEPIGVTTNVGVAVAFAGEAVGVTSIAGVVVVAEAVGLTMNTGATVAEAGEATRVQGDVRSLSFMVSVAAS